MIAFAKELLYNNKINRNINYFYNLGSILGVLIVFQILTGVILSLYYNTATPYDSVVRIFREIEGGYIILSLHNNGANFIFICLYIHIFRALLYGSYVKARGAWYVGILLFLLLIIIAFLGYSLPYGQMSFWAGTVITGFITVIPTIGKILQETILGGYTVSLNTISRFYSLHFLLPLILIPLILIHILLIHNVGGSNPLGLKSGNNQVTFHTAFTYKDIFGFALAWLCLGALVFFFPFHLGHPDNNIPANPFVTPSHILPEFYLLPFYAILRAIPDKALGIIAMLASILVLFLMPSLAGGSYLGASSYFQYLYKIFIYSFSCNFLLLLFLGSQLPIYPFTDLSGWASGIYFGLFLLLPLQGIFDFLCLKYHTAGRRIPALPTPEPMGFGVWRRVPRGTGGRRGWCVPPPPPIPRGVWQNW